MQDSVNIPQVKTDNAKTGETIRELAHRHLMDEHHTTSDEELENARLEFSQPSENPDESLFEIDHTTVIPPLDAEHTGIETDQIATPQPNPYTVLR